MNVKKTLFIKEAPEQPTCLIGNQIVCLSIETTGLDPFEDEVLQISACDGDGNILLNTFIRPYLKQTWCEAERIHGITPETVSNAHLFHEINAQLQEIINSANLIISYNVNFVASFLEKAGVSLDQIIYYDVMIEFAEIYNEWNDYYERYQWQSLATCAHYYNYNKKIKNNLDKISAILYCYKKMTGK